MKSKKIIIMEKEIKNILKAWESSIQRFGKLDSWKLNESLSIIGNYLISNDDSREINNLMRQIRDIVIISSSNETLLTMIKKVLSKIEPEKTIPDCYLVKRNGRILKKGQTIRFKGETKRIFEEKLRFKNDMLLRNFDIETESKADSRRVRRIIEKRMCQAYHRRNKRDGNDPSNKERYWMKRATAFQLHNIGQIENIKNISRGYSTHWKKMFDPQTGEIVFKKKMAYSTQEEALEAIKKWEEGHPSDIRKMTAYKCGICNKWHIGHESIVDTENIVEEEFIDFFYTFNALTRLRSCDC